MLQYIPPKYDTIIITLLAAFFFLPFLGGVHLFDWDEINFAECAREMIVLNDYLRVHINFQPFWEKPPLFFWLQVASMKLWGINEYAARFPNAICGILSLLTIFKIGLKMRNRSFAYVWVLAYIGSILPHLYFKSGIMDPWFNFFIFVGLYFLFEASWKKKEAQNLWKSLILAGICTGLAILVKGPVAGLITGLVLGIYFLWNRFRWYLSLGHFVVYGLVVLATAGLWFGVEIAQNGTWFVETFIQYQIRLLQTHDAGHQGFLGYHFVVLLLGVFPASIFALRHFYWKKETLQTQFDTQTQDFRHWMLILFWVVLILFSLVQSKIVHYSSLCYFPLTFLAALRLEQVFVEKQLLSAIEKYALGGIASLFALVLILLPYVGQHLELLRPLLAKDLFALGNLEANVQWSYWDWIPAVLFTSVIGSFYFLYKKEQRQKAITVLCLGMALFINVALIFFINKIEAYSQGAVIEFYENKQAEDCYIYANYRTYADLFYSKQQPTYNKNTSIKSWLFEGNIDKDVYFVAKIQHLHRLERYTDIKEVYRKNGFVFLKRDSK